MHSKEDDNEMPPGPGFGGIDFYEVRELDKYEYNLKLGEINRLVDEDNYEEAATVADTIEWKRVRNIRTLCMISEIYEANDRLEDSKEILMKAYRRSQMGRSVLYRLTEVCIKLREFDEAVEYYSEYVNAAPNDNSRYILKYKIYKGRGSSLDDQIAILEEFKEKEYTEKWTYELAKLYHKAGNDKKCVETCDDLILWFRQGKYVIKALELKMSITELTPLQKSIYDHRDEMSEEPAEEEMPKVQELEKVIMEKMPSSQEEALTDNIISETQKELAQAVTRHTSEAQNDYVAQPSYHEEPKYEAPQPVCHEEPKYEAPKPSYHEEPKCEAPKPPYQETREYAADSADQDLEGATKIVPVKEIRRARQAAISNQISKEMQHMTEPEPAAPMQPAPQPATPVSDPQPAYDAAKLQAELANSMREIVAGIRRPEREEELIEPKNDFSAFQTSETEPAAPAESIDDVLLSMSGIQPDSQEYVKPASDKVPAAPVIAEPLAEPVPPAASAYQETAAAREIPEEKAAPTPAQPQRPQQAAPQMEPQQVTTRQEAAPAPVQQEGPVAAPAQEPPLNSYRHTGLTRNQQHILGYFATIQGLREQIAASLEDTIHKVLQDKTSRSGNVIITGNAGSGRSTLAMRYAKVVSRAKGEKNARIAKIYAEDFNKKDIPSTVAKIAGGTLIIEEAGDLSEEVVSQLSTAMEFRTNGLVIILEDEKGYLKELMDHHPKFAEKFTSAIDVPIFTNDELVSFGETYALEEDYRIDEGAIASLYDRIGEMQTPDHPVTVADVKEIVDQAIRHVERAGLRKLGMILSRKRYDKEDRVILYAKDFR